MALADWEAYRTHMIISISGVLLLTFGYFVTPLGEFLITPWTLQADVTAALEYSESHPAEVELIIARLRSETEEQDKKLDRLLKYHEKDFEIGGEASVGTFGGDELYIRVNRRSNARVYKDGDRVKITLPDIAGRPDTILVVKGSFSDSRNPDLIISFSKEAADSLGIIGRVEVELEPVNGDE